MALINSIRIARLCINKNPILYTAIRNHWNKDYMPAPFPKTQEQREAAAKKYGLDISEYKPYPDDGTGLGDYPDIPAVSGDARDPHYPWDSPELKRNFNEVMHADVDLMGEDRYDVSARHRLPFYMYFVQFFGVMLGSFAIYLYLDNYRMFPAVLPKQYPTAGKKHYTFEVDGN